MTRPAVAALAWVLSVAGTIAFSAEPTRNYHAYVCAESDDVVELVRFGGDGLELVKSIPVGSFPAEIEGPHGVNVSPDGRHWFVSVSPWNAVRLDSQVRDWNGRVGLAT